MRLGLARCLRTAVSRIRGVIQIVPRLWYGPWLSFNVLPFSFGAQRSALSLEVLWIEGLVARLSLGWYYDALFSETKESFKVISISIFHLPPISSALRCSGSKQHGFSRELSIQFIQGRCLPQHPWSPHCYYLAIRLDVY